MTYYEKMMEAKQKASELRGSITGLVMQANQLQKEEFSKINSNRDLSPEGKAKQRDAFNKKLGDDFMKELRSIKQEYQEAVAKAGVQAEFLLNDKPKKPDDIKVSTFQRELNDLKVKLMLSINSDSSIRMLSHFAEKNKDPYFMSQLAESFPELAGSVLGSAGSDAAKVKTQLSPLFDSIKSAMQTDEQKQAQSIYESTREEFGRNIVLEGGIEASKVRELFGPQVSRFVNRPFEYQTEEEKQQDVAQ